MISRKVASAADVALWQRVAKLDWMTANEAAVYVRFSPRVFEEMVVATPIPFSRPAGPKGDRRFFRADLDAALRSRRENIPAA